MAHIFPQLSNIIRIMSAAVIASAGFTNQKNFLKTLKAAIENFRYAQSNIVGVLLNVIMSLLNAMFPRCSCN